MTTNPIKILLFDDEFDSLIFLKLHLESYFKWSVELTAEEVILERLKIERFDLVVVDSMIQPESENNHGRNVKNVHFEGVNWRGTGREFIRRLRLGEFSSSNGTPADVPIILLSAIADSVVTSAGNDLLTSLKVIEKPFRLEVLVQVIQSEISRK
jgi:hypothetical protein